MATKQCPKCSARFQSDAMFCPMDGNRLVEESDPLIGRRIAGRYLIEEKLSVGGMGMVYRARHMVINRFVAIKFLLPIFARDKVYRHRFLVEARVANQINHAHIVDINDFGETEDGYVYMVMEYLRGRSLGQEIVTGPIPLNRVLHIGIQIVQGLARAHDLGVIHRDIKPENIFLITHKHDSDFVKLLDFGVARLAQDMHITKRGTVIGTPEYMSPEQMRGIDVTGAADLYSVGCVLFEMLTHRLPFEGPESVRIMKMMTEPPPTPSQLVGSIPKEMDAVILKLLEKKPQNRHRDAHHLLEDLQKMTVSLPDPVVHSSQPPSKPPIAPLSDFPSLVNNDQEEWLDRIALYRKLLKKKYPKGDPPKWLTFDINRIETYMHELLGLQKKLSTEAEKATQLENDARETRMRIGNALNELTSDESKIRRQIEQVDAELSSKRSQTTDAMSQVIDSANAIPLESLSDASLLKNELHELTQLVKAGKWLAERKEAEARLEDQKREHCNELEDLHFQIAQLKGKIGTTNAETMFDKDEIHEKTNALDSTLKKKLDFIVPIAERILTHFMDDPQYRELVIDQIPNHPITS